ncbi:hypothetical protein CHLNCDRAFT_140669 [Chlorella variabilis]|uniref:N-acetyltransferase domain-containing protein n=1 Tax=Chlorella variabilis TaxID=554065 RepID=E1Z5X7_CHLVA|nr:hypothetical protein CHLNCDRAFT_140669 [Chlorella variabilis]EFN58832.1 hypothetical protein CHLNCDRAFT_140669 [Chlorella variabilis]|eukprot:XP_005850934.1 hypothetical protein CHLNCDRAFT_140669 [Chlorella variabilis]
MAIQNTASAALAVPHQEQQPLEGQADSQQRQQTPTAAAAVPEPPLPSLPQSRQPGVTVRRYCAERDHVDVAHICRNVYGGTDELPATINAAAAEPGTHILVACSGGQGAPLDALLCCQQRGDVLWLWGARTREERRGAGLAQLLLEEAEALARSLPGVASLLSVTVPANDTMLRLFARCGFRQQCEVVSWPATDVCVAAHRQLQEPRQQQGGGGSLQVPEKQAGSPQQATMLSILPKTAAVVDNAAARQLLPHWRRCLSPHHLTAVLLLLRQQRTRSQVAQLAAARPRGQQRPEAGAANSAAEAAQAVAPLAADSAVFAWLPAEYEVVPAMHPTVQQLIADGGVWLLETATPQGTSDRSLQERAEDGGGAAERPGPAAVLVLWGAGFRGVRHAGVVAGSAAALDSALLCAAAADPACCRFYVDCCSQFEHERLWSSTGGQRYDILPHYKPL